MKEIRIGPGVQIALLLGALAALAAILVPMLPDLQRYQKIRSM